MRSCGPEFIFSKESSQEEAREYHEEEEEEEEEDEDEEEEEEEEERGKKRIRDKDGSVPESPQKRQRLDEFNPISTVGLPHDGFNYELDGPPQVGALVEALNPADDRWYSAQIKSVKGVAPWFDQVTTFHSRTRQGLA